MSSLTVLPSTLSSFFASSAADDETVPQPSSSSRQGRSRQPRRGPQKQGTLTWTRLVMLLAHHCGTAYLGMLVYLALIAQPMRRRQLLLNNNRNPALEDSSTVKAVGIGMLMLAMGLYANDAFLLWLLLWAILWAVALVKMPSSTAGLLLLVHFWWLLSAAPHVREMLVGT